MRPRRRAGDWKSVLPGALILVGLLVTSTLVFFMDTIRRGLMEGPRIVVLAAEARGLVPGADVWIAGSRSGRVVDVRFADPEGPEEGRVVIHAVLHWTALPHLRSSASARVGSSALLAPTVLKLEPGEADSGTFDPADTLVVPPAATRDRFVTLATEGKAVADSLVAQLSTLSGQLEGGTGTVASMRRDTALLRALRRMGASARLVAEALGSETALPARVAADSVGPTLRRIASGFQSMARDERTAAVSDSIATLLATLERISERLVTVDRRMQEGTGTVGRALYDLEIRRQQRLLGSRLDSVRNEVLRRPWRWLRFKLF